MTDGLLRQRRNLLLASTVLIFLRYGGVKITDVSLLGTVLEFDDIGALYAGLWLLFLYFFVRYYQYFRQETDLGIASSFWGQMDKISKAKLITAGKQLVKNKNESPSGEFQFSNLKRVDLFKLSGSVVVDRDEFGDPHVEVYEVNELRYLFKYAQSVAHTCFNTSAVTDTVLPFALAVFAFAYTLRGPWEGSFCSVFKLPC